MKKLALLLAILLTFSIVAVGCGGSEKPVDGTGNEENNDQNNDQGNEDIDLGELEDGIYFAQEDNFSEKSGWKYVLVLEVKDNEIVDVNWTGAHKDGGTDKKTRAQDGEYGMIKASEIGKEWHEQAEVVEQYLLEVQDPTKITLNDDGTTDVIAGASLKVNAIVELAQKALSNGPTGKGQYKDGAYYAEEEAFNHGWKYTASITVVNGYIVAADWDGIAEEGEKSKDQASADGDYGMVEKGGAIAPWVEQADAAEQYLIQTQDPTDLEYTTEEGHTDAIAGATIHVKEFFVLAEEALKDAK